MICRLISAAHTHTISRSVSPSCAAGPSASHRDASETWMKDYESEEELTKLEIFTRLTNYHWWCPSLSAKLVGLTPISLGFMVDTELRGTTLQNWDLEWIWSISFVQNMCSLILTNKNAIFTNTRDHCYGHSFHHGKHYHTIQRIGRGDKLTALTTYRLFFLFSRLEATSHGINQLSVGLIFFLTRHIWYLYDSVCTCILWFSTVYIDVQQPRTMDTSTINHS